MGSEMGVDTLHSHEAGPVNLRKKLAVAVRSIQWSYAIFWSLSTRQQGILEWVDGYYNGDIKTTKTAQAMETKHEKIGLQRSEQLRELYKYLLEGEIEQQAKRPSAALSPEDLSDTEWYYLVCMSFAFSPGEGLPGRALANKETIWLCDAQYADCKVFSRSLLAKSASIQTVVCFPHLDGVIELGATELVAEDPNLIQHIKASLLEFSKPVCSDKPSSTTHSADNDKDPIRVHVDHESVDTLAAFENLFIPSKDVTFEQEGIHELHEELNMDSPDDCSNGCKHNQQAQDSILEVLNGGISRVQSWYFMDDELRNGVIDSINSTDCISEAFLGEGEKTASFHQLKALQEGNHTKLSSLDLRSNDDLHYKRTLYVVLRGSPHVIEQNSCFFSDNHKSSFLTWQKGGGIFNGHRPQVQQNMLKRILFTVPLMHGGNPFRSDKENGGKDSLTKLKSKEIYDRSLSGKQRESENFLILKSMIPSVSEMDKALILDDMIRYLKELEARVEELESCTDSVDYTARPRRNCLDVAEQTSDNYGNKKIESGKKLWLTKRKANDIYETDPELDEELSDDGLPSDVIKVSVREKEVLIEMTCVYREFIFLDIMDEINNLHLDVFSIQSHTINGILSLTLKSKFRGAAVAPARMIKHALLKISSKS